ncbi:hypothetical protein NPX13_g8233 [Xylaria arbuscula]|uniref:UPF0261 domain-containing protein n=1 Tax=Xylaria arbuscula TaxID=114810 RepID=A0A9W8N958_9PEZI|nr:hypothetical protein NPX13_g8233 [Xylaria arbuscula]
MRTTRDECEELGKRIANRLRTNCVNPEAIEVWLPLKGVSVIAVEGEAFFDKKADEALFGAIRTGLDGSGIAVKEIDTHINSPKWAESIAQQLADLAGRVGKGY